MRYTVFGVRKGLMVEHSTNLIQKAVLIAKINSNEGFRARIWDAATKGFVKAVHINDGKNNIKVLRFT